MKAPDCVPVISDPSYTKTGWFSDIMTALSAAVGRARRHVMLISRDNAGIDWAGLPPAAIVTNGAASYLYDTVARLQGAGKSVILAGVDPSPFPPPVSCVTLSRGQETLTLIRYMRGNGRDEIAFVGFRRDGVNDMFRYQMLQWAAPRLGDVVAPRKFFFWERGSALECVDRFIDVSAAFDAVICPNDMFGILLMRRCAERGIGVPGDLLVGSFGNIHVSSLARPGLTAFAGDYFAIGTHSYKAWEYLSTGNEAGASLQIEVPSRLYIRGSTAFLPLPGGADPKRNETPVPVDGSARTDAFYEDVDIQGVVRLERGLMKTDALDRQVLALLLDGVGYEAIAQRLFLSVSSVRYRVNSIYKEADVAGKKEFLALFRKYLGAHNPFRDGNGGGGGG